MRQPGLFLFSSDAYRRDRMQQLHAAGTVEAQAQHITVQELAMLGFKDTVEVELLFGDLRTP